MPPSNENRGADAQLTEEQYIRLTKGVYEVVVPRIEDKDIVYQEKLPEHLLPFKIRKSPYRGIGTAFAIAPNRFVSAAHVFDLHQHSQINPIFLRDLDGKIYPLDKVQRYSQHRDLIEFTLKAPPKDVLPLGISKQARMGQFVFTVGNALGDGIVTRSGYITSFTPEPINGEWNDVRYSAPASPGNSGGPLLDKNLEVVGIVARRTENENLNFAIPIVELEKTKGAHFFIRDIKLEQFKKQLSRDWTFQVALPLTPAELTKIAAKNHIEFQEKLYNDFQKEYKKDVFPTDPKLKSWAKDSLAINLAGFIQKDANDKWVTAPLDWDITKLEKYQAIVIEKNAARSDTGLFLLERPLNRKLKDFYQDGKAILDAYLKQIGWARNYAGRRIPVLSFGKPEETFRWSDSYGRKWISWQWNTMFDDRSIMLQCLPMPAGVFCVFSKDSYRQMELTRVSMRRAANRFLIDMYGKVRDWKEWHALPEEWKQNIIPQNSTIAINGEVVTWKSGAFSGKVTDKHFDQDAEMSLSFISSPEDIFKLRLRNVQVAEKEGDIQLGAGSNQRPDEEGNASYREVWEKMLERRAPYNGEPQTQGKHSLIVRVLSEENAKNTQRLHFATCGIIGSVGDAKIRKMCKDFSNSVTVSK